MFCTDLESDQQESIKEHNCLLIYKLCSFSCVYYPYSGSVSYNPIMKDCSVVCLEAMEAILVDLLTGNSSKFVSLIIIDSKHAFLCTINYFTHSWWFLII